MENIIKKWLKRVISCAIVLTISSPLTAKVYGVTLPEIKITESSVIQETINPDNGEKLSIKYCIDNSAYITSGIYKASGTNSSQKVDLMDNYVQKAAGCYNLTWDGKNGEESEIGKFGEKVADGQYFYGIRAQGIENTTIGDVYVSKWIYVKTTSTQEELKLSDVELDNSIFDPENDQEVEFTFIINKGAYITLEIYDEDDEEVKTIVDEKFYEAGEHSLDWDGEDKMGDTVSEGEYEYKLIATYGEEKEVEKGEIIVKEGYELDDTSEDPRIEDAFVTKESFDPGRNETTNIVFTLTAAADVKVAIYDEKGNKVKEIMDSDDLSEGTYIVEWDAEDFDGDKAVFTYKITAENSKGEDTVSDEIQIEEDYESSKKPNIFKDEVDLIIYELKDENLELSFKLDREASVSLEIRDGDYVIATVIEENDMDEGPRTLNWDGKDNYGEYVENGVYNYKLTAENNYGKDVERGYFEVQKASEAKNPAGSCAAFSDVPKDFKYCEAITWAASEDIFEGYTDGTFKPNQSINRVEALKVILKSMGVKILNSNGGDLGFSDVDRYGWYMPYLETALSLGIVVGYPDGTFKPDKPVSTIEGLVMVLNTGKVKYGIIIPTNNYGQPYYDTPNTTEAKWYLSYAWYAQSYDLTDNEYYLFPGAYMTRGEMADMLYRFDKIN